jgi:hypothetical protein
VHDCPNGSGLFAVLHGSFGQHVVRAGLEGAKKDFGIDVDTKDGLEV